MRKSIVIINLTIVVGKMVYAAKLAIVKHVFLMVYHVRLVSQDIKLQMIIDV